MTTDNNNQPTAHTPGPWKFILNEDSKTLMLVSQTPMRPIVMDFKRWGMQSATARLNKENLMYEADHFGVVLRGHEHHAHFLKGIGHPDAQLIEASPLLLTGIKRVLD